MPTKDITTGAPRAVYDSRHRLGAYRQRDDKLFVAVDRLDRPLGVFDSAFEAIEAIGKASATAGVS